jgi:hypothetical protein
MTQKLTVDGNASLLASTGSIYVGTIRALHIYGTANTFAGPLAGNQTLTGKGNTAIGYEAGFKLSSGNCNTLVGCFSGGTPTHGVTTGSHNIGLGYANLSWLTGSYNIVIGDSSGMGTGGTMSNNIMLGHKVSAGPIDMSENVLIGKNAGTSLQYAKGNIFLGYNVGASLTADSNRLIIDNHDTTAPLIDGDMANHVLTINGNTKTQGLFANITVSSDTLPYHVTATDYTILKQVALYVNDTVYLPSASTNTGRILRIIASDLSNYVTTNVVIAADGSDLIYSSMAITGESSYELDAFYNHRVEIQSDGTRWWMINN